MASLTSRCMHEFAAQVRGRGALYFAEGAVRVIKVDAQSCRAKVAGTEDYRLTLDWSLASAGSVIATCTCPYFDDMGNCKHLYALLLQLDRQGVGGQVPGTKMLKLLGSDDDEDDDDDDEDFEDDIEGDDFDDDDDFASPPLSARRLPAAKQKDVQPAWIKQLAQVATPQLGSTSPPVTSANRLCEVFSYVIDLTASQQSKELQLRVLVQRPKANGELSKRQTHSIIPRELDLYRHHPDHDLLCWLSAVGEESGYRSYGYGASVGISSNFTLPTVAWPQLLPRLVATGRLAWAVSSAPPVPDANLHPLQWEDGAPWKFVLRIEPHAEQDAWQLSGRLRREDPAAELDLKQAVFVSAQDLVLWESSLARCESSPFMHWIELLRRDEPIVIPFTQREPFLARLYGMENLPAIECPESLHCEELRAAPRGKLKINEPTRHFDRSDDLVVQVQFCYGDVLFTPKSTEGAKFDAAKNRVLLRDREAETELLKQLSMLSFRAHQHWGVNADLLISARQLPKVVPALIAQGWEVEAHGGLVRRAGEFNFTVTSGVDWFELAGECDFDGQQVQLPAILAALKRGETYIRLGDGSQGMLPQEWLARYGALAELAEVDQTTLKFKPTQALLLDALLASQTNVSIDQRFAAAREKLRSFRGVAAAETPKGFVGELRPYQQEGLGWLKFLQDFGFGGCLADDMGLGKTIQVLAMLEQQRSRRRSKTQPRRPSLVVVPRSLIFNWLAEAARFAPKLKVLDFSTTARAAQWDKFGEHDVVLTTYGVMLRDIAKLHPVEFDYVILDEAQAIKNSNSQSAKAARLLSAQHRLAMTGTPVENHLGELWSILEFLNPGMLGQSSAFTGLIDVASKGTLAGQRESLSLLSQSIAPFILRRTKQEVLKDLPEKTEQTIYCDLSTAERKKYNELRDYYRASLTSTISEKGLEKSKIHVLEALLRLRQASCHLGLLDSKETEATSAKLEVLLEQLDELAAEGHKALVFSQFTSLLAIVRKHLDKRNVSYEYLDGKTRDRQARVDRFQNDPKLPLFLISLKAGGRGLNLTAADYVFILDPWWNPAVEAQAVDRAHRIGQTQKVFAYRLIARDTVEDKILELQRSKRELADAIITADSSVLKNLTSDDLQTLLS